MAKAGINLQIDGIVTPTPSHISISILLGKNKDLKSKEKQIFSESAGDSCSIRRLHPWKKQLQFFASQQRNLLEKCNSPPKKNNKVLQLLITQYLNKYICTEVQNI